MPRENSNSATDKNPLLPIPNKMDFLKALRTEKKIRNEQLTEAKELLTELKQLLEMQPPTYTR